MSLELLNMVAATLGVAFFVVLLGQVGLNFINLFVGRRHGRNHALAGLCYLTILVCEFADAATMVELKSEARRFAVDVALGVFGIALTISAARDFGHHGINNVASGTLDQHATVTYDEMIEHAFYQGLNLVQIVSLHAVSGWAYFHRDVSTAAAAAATTTSASPNTVLILRRGALLLAATLPWLFRASFPVHSFSLNFTKNDPRSTPLVRFLYRVKKWQYVFYKACLLHGLNIAVALGPSGPSGLVHSRPFRLYWALLNAAYVMEFFLQTLVKKGYMAQSNMLCLNGLLMLASSAAAVHTLLLVYPSVSSLTPAVLSLAANFAFRGHDTVNTMLIYAALACLHHHQAY